MNFDDFKISLAKSSPPKLSEPLQALWYAGKGNWETSHNIAQEINTQTGSWIHAYLHRVEGDLSNATYWYNRAAKPVPKVSLQQEWEIIVKAVLPK